MAKHLRYCVMGASMDYDENRHPEFVMRELGINYRRGIPITVGQQWWFCNCENIPDKLPTYITHIKAKATLDQIKKYIAAEKPENEDVR